MIKKLVRRELERRGWTLAKTGHLPGLLHGRELLQFLQSRSIDLVFDVGANVGQFGVELRQIGYRGQLISFEPISSAFSELSRLADRDARWDVHNIGLGSASGELELNVSRATVFSSFVPMTAAASEFDEGSTTSAVVRVPVRTLDDFKQATVGRRTFLKIDTQGFEEQVLKGGEEFLKAALGVQLELPIVHLYQEVWNVEEAISYMRDRGFLPAFFWSVNSMVDDPSCLEVDCVFRRA